MAAVVVEEEAADIPQAADTGADALARAIVARGAAKEEAIAVPGADPEAARR